MKAVVYYQSRTGNTRKAAEMIGAELIARGCDASVRSVDNVDYAELAEAGLVCVGTWVDGLIMFGQRTGDQGKVAQLPMLWNKPTAAFMTYAVRCGKGIDRFADFLHEDLGAAVFAGQALKNNQLDKLVPPFVDHVFDELAQLKKAAS